MKISTTFRKIIKHPGIKLWAVAFWLVLWQLIYEFTGEDSRDLLLSSPVQVFKRLLENFGTDSYWRMLLFSLTHVMSGMLLGAVCGTLLGVLSFFVFFIRELLKPLISVIRSVPVVAFIIIAVYWVGYRDLGMFIAFLICFPVFYSNTQAGLSNADMQLMEMADVFNMSFWSRLRAIYLPALLSHLPAAGEVAVGLSWKSGIAAEYIGTVTSVLSIGKGLYDAKTQWSTVDVMAWTVSIVALSALCGFIVKTLMRLSAEKWGNGK